MKRLIALAAMSLIASGAAFAADAPAAATTAAKPTTTTAAPAKTTTNAAADKAAPPAADKPLTAQQQKMKTCNVQAADKKGDDRSKFMKTCLSAKPAKPENKMAMCNSKTKGLTKEEADKVRSDCMKG